MSKDGMIYAVSNKEEVNIEKSNNIFENNLFVGVETIEVKKLQKYLNKNGFGLATSGLGSLNNETNFFGKLTKLALIKFQKANNITPAFGFFGPITRGVINNIILIKQ